MQATKKSGSKMPLILQRALLVHSNYIPHTFNPYGDFTMSYFSWDDPEQAPHERDCIAHVCVSIYASCFRPLLVTIYCKLNQMSTFKYLRRSLQDQSCEPVHSYEGQWRATTIQSAALATWSNN